MRDEEKLQQALVNNKEVLVNLEGLRGTYRAEMTSAMANLSLIVSTTPAPLCDVLAEIGASLMAGLYREHKWPIEEMEADINMLRKQRMVEL